MINNKRKSRRRQVRYTAWLVLEGGQPHSCELSDASDTGARLDVEDSKIIPDTFKLLLAGNGSAQRTRPLVVGRQPQQVGVKFEQRLARHDRATLVPVLNADKATAQAEPAETA